MRRISTASIGEKLYEILMTVNFELPGDVRGAIENALEVEEHGVSRSILKRLLENNALAMKKRIPLCQDTGMVVVFLEIGQEVVLEGEYIEEALNQSIARAYEEGYLRKSIVSNPLTRINTGDNTPGVFHYSLVPGEHIRMGVTVKGFGSENMSRLGMLRPSDGVEGVKAFVLETVALAGPNPCPPIIVGVGIGGTMEKAALLSKVALMRDIGTDNPLASLDQLEKDWMKSIEALGIGPMGMGGRTTALGVHIETYPTHIAGLPVAVNINCHSSRHSEVIL
ncbi:MAG: fumarate hydratase [delta proteobacterium ML8_F1]|nr:MAG: fumarate hydratase [delta proteobacterium ML8_F1]